MAHDWNELRLYFEVFVFGFNGLLAVYVWWMGKNRATDESLRQLKNVWQDNVAEIHARLQKVEIESLHAPKHADLNRLHERIDDVNNALQRLLGEFQQIRSGVNMIQQFLLQAREDGR
jgi:tetrahydromethanopterin S-methyltransferase subunit G